jgi:hypothetical protein
LNVVDVVNKCECLFFFQLKISKDATNIILYLALINDNNDDNNHQCSPVSPDLFTEDTSNENTNDECAQTTSIRDDVVNNENVVNCNDENVVNLYSDNNDDMDWMNYYDCMFCFCV